MYDIFDFLIIEPLYLTVVTILQLLIIVTSYLVIAALYLTIAIFYLIRCIKVEHLF